MAIAHTPGSWRLNADNSTEVMTVTGLNVARAHCGGIYHIKLAQAEANARLIAAAPDLLAACEAVLPWLGGLANENPSVAPEYTQLFAAIAKATGK